jgi:hypothetical protein
LVGRQEHIPFDSDLSDFTRTVLCCPVAGCFVVAMIYDEEKIDVRTCCVCGERIKFGEAITSMSDMRCNKCKNNAKYAYRRGKQPKRGRWKHRADVPDAPKRSARGARMRAAKRVGRHVAL